MNIRSGVKYLFLAAAVYALSACMTDRPAHSGSNPAGISGNASIHKSYGGRDYRLYIPYSLPQGTKAPLVVVLHGGLGNAEGIEKALGLNQVAEKNGLIIAYLNGTGGRFGKMKNRRTWNAGSCCGPAKRKNINDVEFIEAVIRNLTASHPIDPDRIYMAGHSNGAMMTYRFACERPGIVAAIVPISGPLLVNHCNAGNVKVLHIHGQEDNNVPSAGGVGGKSVTRVKYRSVAETSRILQQAGASFELRMIPGGGHHLDDLDSASRRSSSMSLAEIIARFVDGKTMRP